MVLQAWGRHGERSARLVLWVDRDVVKHQTHPVRRVGASIDVAQHSAEPHRISHFPGSSILHWDRLSEPAPLKSDLPSRPTPVSGIILTADTIMVQPDLRKFTFIWSVPNMVRSPQYALSAAANHR